MTTLKEIIEEIDDLGQQYKFLKSDEGRKSYDQYVDLLIINNAHKRDWGYLCNYWEESKEVKDENAK